MARVDQAAGSNETRRGKPLRRWCYFWLEPIDDSLARWSSVTKPGATAKASLLSRSCRPAARISSQSGREGASARAEQAAELYRSIRAIVVSSHTGGETGPQAAWLETEETFVPVEARRGQDFAAKFSQTCALPGSGVTCRTIYDEVRGSTETKATPDAEPFQNLPPGIRHGLAVRREAPRHVCTPLLYDVHQQNLHSPSCCREDYGEERSIPSPRGLPGICNATSTPFLRDQCSKHPSAARAKIRQGEDTCPSPPALLRASQMPNEGKSLRPDCAVVPCGLSDVALEGP
ncbi:hypothetical protein ACCO45_007951 [Purpureocillium lilacinum]|uniref:Uncharacterized protein n=1 Tax=Purpureocillium lilacinum TaxID=33203 RepID=A0ACC4DMM6_PURLI